MRHLILPFLLLLLKVPGRAQQKSEVDFKQLDARVQVHPQEKIVVGEVRFIFDILKDTDSIFIDAREMEISNFSLNGNPVDFHNDGKRLGFASPSKISEENELRFNYTAAPRQTMYFIGWDYPDTSYKPQVWTQGQGKYTSHWLPSFDDPTEKLIFNLDLIFPENLEVISNGKLVAKEAEGDTLTRWQFEMQQPMSSYLVAVAAGTYYKEEIVSSSGVPISLYFYPGDENKLEPTYRYTEQIFDFLEKETGVPYPWQDYKQIPVRDFLYSGMENTGATIFSDIFVIDSIGFHDRNYVMVNSHEMAHQWFGDLVTAASGEHHWLQEGFATYYALLAEKEVFGEEHYYWSLFQSAEQLKEMSDSGKGQSLMDPKASSLTFYQKGAWALHMLREMLGDDDFRKGIKNYLELYKYSSATIPQFLEVMEEASGKDLLEYQAQWLRQTAFPGTAALESLQKSAFMEQYLSIAAFKAVSLAEKRRVLAAALEFPVNDYIGQEVVYQLALEDPSEALELYQQAFKSNNLLVRQAIALSMNRIPRELKPHFESLLTDESYLTREAALYNLWMNFPEDRNKYLDRIEGQEGFSDKNLRTLWLALNLATPEYKEASQAEVYMELAGYTSPQYPYLLRQNAFKYLFQLNSFRDQNLQDLLEASQHHVGQFKNFSRDLLKQLLENQTYKTRYQGMMNDLPEQQRAYLESLLKE